MSVRRFFSARGVAILASELRWVWLPSAVLAVAMMLVRRRSTEVAPASNVRHRLA